MIEEFEQLSLKIKELKNELNLLNTMLNFKEQEYREIDEKVKNIIKQLEENKNSKKRKYKFVM